MYFDRELIRREIIRTVWIKFLSGVKTDKTYRITAYSLNQTIYSFIIYITWTVTDCCYRCCRRNFQSFEFSHWGNDHELLIFSKLPDNNAASNPVGIWVRISIYFSFAWYVDNSPFCTRTIISSSKADSRSSYFSYNRSSHISRRHGNNFCSASDMDVTANTILIIVSWFRCTSSGTNTCSSARTKCCYIGIAFYYNRSWRSSISTADTCCEGVWITLSV